MGFLDIIIQISRPITQCCSLERIELGRLYFLVKHGGGERWRRFFAVRRFHVTANMLFSMVNCDLIAA